jgi:hypothetical protein
MGFGFIVPDEFDDVRVMALLENTAFSLKNFALVGFQSKRLYDFDGH